MAEASRDNNQIPTLLGTSNADGTTPVKIRVVDADHTICVDIGTTGSDLSGDDASRDANGVPVMMGVSSVDGVTPVPIYADPVTGALLVKIT